MRARRSVLWKLTVAYSLFCAVPFTDSGAAAQGREALPTGAISRLGSLRLRHDVLGIDAVVFSQRGDLLASAGADLDRSASETFGRTVVEQTIPTVRVWSVQSGECVLMLTRPRDEDIRPNHHFRALAFSPDGDMLAAADDCGHITVWTLRDRSVQRNFRTESLATSSEVVHLEFSPDGHILAHAAGDVVLLFDCIIGEPRQRLRIGGSSDHVTSVSFSRDGRFFAASTERGHSDPPPEPVLVWKVKSGAIQQAWTVAEAQRGRKPRSAEEVVFLSDGETLLTRHGPASVQLWNAKTGVVREVYRVPRRIDRITPGGLAIGRNGDILLVHDLLTGRTVCEFHPRSWGGVWAVSPDDRVFAVADQVIRLFDLRTGRELHDPGITATISDGAFSGDGHEFLSADALWDANTGKLVALAEPGSATFFDPDGTPLAATPHGHELRVLELRRGTERFRVSLMEEEGVRSLHSSADGRWLLVQTYYPHRKYSRRALCVETTTGRMVDILFSDHWPKLGEELLVTFSATGDRVALLFPRQDYLGIWRLDLPEQAPDPVVSRKLSLGGRGWNWRRPCLSPDLKYLASHELKARSHDLPERAGAHTIVVTAVDDGKQIARIISNPGGGASDLAFLPDGERLISRQGRICIWDARTGNNLSLRPGADWPHPLELAVVGHDLGVGKALYLATLSNEGTALASVHSIGHVRLQVLPSYEEVASFSTGDRPVRVLRLAPDKSRILTGFADGTALIWSLPADARPRSE